MTVLVKMESITALGNLVFGEMASTALAVQSFKLPPLPYNYNALEPHISTEIMTLHHDKHHQAYVTNLNTALADYSIATSQGRIADQIALQSSIRFHGGGHINHALFWRTLAPANSTDAREPEVKAPRLLAALASEYGSLDDFIAAFSSTLLSIQGSGWGWLVRSGSGASVRLYITTTKDQDPVVDSVPIIGIDMWEHAYYLQYKNGKQSYVENVWKIINWTTAETRYTGPRDEAYDFIEVTLSG